MSLINLDEYRKRKHISQTSSHVNPDKQLTAEKKITLATKLPMYQTIMANKTDSAYSLLDIEQHIALYAYQQTHGKNLHAINLTAAIEYGRTTTLYHRFRSIVIHPSLRRFSDHDRIAYACYELKINQK